MARVFQLGFRPDPVAYIFGAGHVGKATSEAASLVGFRVIITDDRPELLTRERFPKASMLRIIDNFADPLAASRDAPAIEIGPQGLRYDTHPKARYRQGNAIMSFGEQKQAILVLLVLRPNAMAFGGASRRRLPQTSIFRECILPLALELEQKRRKKSQ